MVASLASRVRLSCSVAALVLAAALLVAAPASAESGPQLTVEPASAGPGETVQVRGSGWPAGVTVVIWFRESDDSDSTRVQSVHKAADADGAFAADLIVPSSLFGVNSRSIVNVVPGDYEIVANVPDVAVKTILTVTAPHAYPLLWGEVYFDIDHDGVRSDADRPTFANVEARGAVHGSPVLGAMADARGRYMITPRTGPGRYDLTTRVERGDVAWIGNASIWLTTGQVSRADLLLHPEPLNPERCFAETGFCVTQGAFWEYFNARGGLKVFGYPVSRTFMLEGKTTQLFQRLALQFEPGIGVTRLNLLDPGIMPYTRINGATFPAYDAEVATAAPAPNTPDYGRAVLQHLRAWVPDDLAGRRVGFLSSYLSAGQTNPGDFPALVSLEIWGFPTSRPVADPNNNEFVYQRFQRGILHYQGTDPQGNPITSGILLADWLKSLITGRGLPVDLESEARANGSRFLRQYCPDKPDSVCRPATLPATDFTMAFEREF